MIHGIPAKDKGIEGGLELAKEKDKNGNWLTPGSGLLTDKEKKKVEALMNKKSTTIRLK
jgi:hypothetical protein